MSQSASAAIIGRVMTKQKERAIWNLVNIASVGTFVANDEKIFALDTEDNSKGKVFLLNFYDGQAHTTFRNPDEAWYWLGNQGPSVVWACNMEYDLTNTFGIFLERILTLTYANSIFVKAYWPGKKIHFRDTLRHWPLSVEKMGGTINLPKLVPSGKEKFDDVAYCRRDTEIVWRFVQEMSARYKSLGAPMKNTLPSTAFAYYKEKFCPIDLDRPSDGVCDKLKGAAYGGRVEIFKTGLLDGPVDYYDVNSLYPFVMATNFYPLPSSGRFVDHPSFQGAGVASCEVSYPKIAIPGLPVRYDGKLIFPCGRFTGTWCYPEIRQAIKDGAKILRVFWAYEYSKWCAPFKDFITTVYNKRKREKDFLMNYTYKIFMNSVFGKFNESGELTVYKNGIPHKRSNRPRHANVILSAYTTAYGRLHLLKYLRQAGDSLCYCDTDSVFIQKGEKLKTGGELGEFKHEGAFFAAHFILPKTYLLVDQTGGRSFKAKGIPRRSIEQFFTSHSAEYDSPIRFRESRRRHLPANVWVKKVRKLCATYTKRLIFNDGHTEPILLG